MITYQCLPRRFTREVRHTCTRPHTRPHTHHSHTRILISCVLLSQCYASFRPLCLLPPFHTHLPTHSHLPTHTAHTHTTEVSSTAATGTSVLSVLANDDDVGPATGNVRHQHTHLVTNNFCRQIGNFHLKSCNFDTTCVSSPP